MELKDYFSKSFETCDNHRIPELRTHYYQAQYDNTLKAIAIVLKDMGAVIKSVDEKHKEIFTDASDFTGTITISMASFSVSAVDIHVMTYNILPTAKGKKIITRFYELLDTKLSLKQIGK